MSRETWDLYEKRSDREQYLAQLKRDQAMTNKRLQLRRKDGSTVTGVVNASIIPVEGGESQVLGTMVEES